jgi:hypothetical protein
MHGPTGSGRPLLGVHQVERRRLDDFVFGGQPRQHGRGEDSPRLERSHSVQRGIAPRSPGVAQGGGQVHIVRQVDHFGGFGLARWLTRHNRALPRSRARVSV